MFSLDNICSTTDEKMFNLYCTDAMIVCLPLASTTHLEEVQHSQEGRSLQEGRLGQLKDVREAGAGHGCQAAALQAGDGRQQVESELRDV